MAKKKVETLTGPKWEGTPEEEAMWVRQMEKAGQATSTEMSEEEARGILEAGVEEMESQGQEGLAAQLRATLADPKKFAQSLAKLRKAREAGEV